MTGFIEVTRNGHILEVKLNKPKVNAIDHAMSRDMGKAFALLRDDPELRVGILTAEGERIFSAGWDLKALNSGSIKLDNWWEDGDYGDGGFAGLTENWNLNKPVIAAINGLAIGGGFEIALSCDLIIAAQHAEFALPEMPLGIVPDAGALQRLPRRLPYNIAMEMLLLGRRMGAEEAARYGLVNKIVPAAELMTTARAWAGQLAKSAPLAMQTVKEVLRAIECRHLWQRLACSQANQPLDLDAYAGADQRRFGLVAVVTGAISAPSTLGLPISAATTMSRASSICSITISSAVAASPACACSAPLRAQKLTAKAAASNPLTWQTGSPGSTCLRPPSVKTCHSPPSFCQ